MSPIPSHTTWRGLNEVCSLVPRPDRPFALRHGVLLSHADFLADACAWRQVLQGHPCEAVAIFCKDSAAFAAMLFGAWSAGKSVVLPGDALAATVQRVAPMVGASLGDLPGALAAPAPIPPVALPALDLLKTRLSLFTSGSAGEPVAISKTLAQLDAEMRTLQAAWGDRLDLEGQPTLVTTTVSHQHIYGLLFVVLWSLAAGRPFLAEKLDYLEALDPVSANAPCCLVASPAHLARLPAAPNGAAGLAALRAVFSSGGPLSAEAAADASQKLGVSPIEVFGSSETGGIAWRQRRTHGDHWMPLPGVDWRLEEGLLSVRSPHLPDTAWVVTSDQALDMGNGTFVLQGRSDRIVKIAEKRVSLNAIERALQRSPLLEEAKALVLAEGRVAVVAVPSAEGREWLALRDRRAFADLLREQLAGELERVAWPRRWRFLESLPVNSQGKTPQALLQALFTAHPSLIGAPQCEWLQRKDDEAICRLVAEPGSVVFDGHFPAHPILPGVIQVDWAARLGQHAFDIQMPFAAIEQLKFRQMITPGLSVQLTLSWNPAARRLGFVYASEQGEHARGVLKFGASTHGQAT